MRCTTTLWRILAVGLILIGPARAAPGQQALLVPANYPTIQAAIDAAGTGDTVLVAPGTYLENIDFKGKTIAVRSRDGAAVTTIDGQRKTSVVRFDSGEGRRTVLDGFTITNGGYVYPTPPVSGGGVHCRGSSPTIIDNWIVGNRLSTSDKGGGVYCSMASPILIGNAIANNRAGTGGGVYWTGGRLRMVGNVVKENSALGGNGGGVVASVISAHFANNEIRDNGSVTSIGGIDCIATHATFARNRIIGNSSNGAVGGVQCKATTATFRDNFVYDNYADSTGGGITCIVTKRATFTNDVIRKNRGFSRVGGLLLSGPAALANVTVIENSTWSNNGGGIAIFGGPVAITNSIFWQNRALFGDEIWLDSTATLSIWYSDVRGGMTSVFVTNGATLNWGAGMIDADPLFVGPEFDEVHLAADSSCRDAGTNRVAGLPRVDLEGDPRIADARVDIGADEFFPHLYVLGTPTAGSTLELRVVGEPTANVWWGISFDPRPLRRPIVLPGLRGVLGLRPPIVVLPLGGLPASGSLRLSIPLPATLPPGDYPMQALVGLQLTVVEVVPIG